MIHDEVVKKSLGYDESLFIGDKSGIYDRILRIKDNIVDKQENLLVIFILYIKLKSSRFKTLLIFMSYNGFVSL